MAAAVTHLDLYWMQFKGTRPRVEEASKQKRNSKQRKMKMQTLFTLGKAELLSPPVANLVTAELRQPCDGVQSIHAAGYILFLFH